MMQHEQGEATAGPLDVVPFGHHQNTESADQPVQQALARILADGLQHRCFDYSVDAVWMSNTHDSWRKVLSSAIHKNSLARRLADATDVAGTVGTSTLRRDADSPAQPEVQVSHCDLSCRHCIEAEADP